MYISGIYLWCVCIRGVAPTLCPLCPVPFHNHSTGICVEATCPLFSPFPCLLPVSLAFSSCHQSLPGDGLLGTLPRHEQPPGAGSWAQLLAAVMEASSCRTSQLSPPLGSAFGICRPRGFVEVSASAIGGCCALANSFCWRLPENLGAAGGDGAQAGQHPHGVTQL